MDPQLLEACGPNPTWPCDQVYRATENVALAKSVRFVVGTPLTILLILLGAWVFSLVLRRMIRRFTNALVARVSDSDRVRAAARTQTLGHVLRSLASLFVWGFATLIIMGELGVNLGPLIAGAGIAGVAIGFGAQSLVKDFLAGLFLLVEDQYGVGDVVDLGLASGTVESITMRATTVRSVDGTLWHVPNGGVDRVGNRSQDWSRAVFDVSVAYDTDLRQATAVIEDAAAGMVQDDVWGRELLEAPEVWGVERLDGAAVDIRLVVKTAPAAQFRVLRELRLRIKDALDAAGIKPGAPVFPGL